MTLSVARAIFPDGISIVEIIEISRSRAKGRASKAPRLNPFYLTRNEGLSYRARACLIHDLILGILHRGEMNRDRNIVRFEPPARLTLAENPTYVTTRLISIAAGIKGFARRSATLRALYRSHRVKVRSLRGW